VLIAVFLLSFIASYVVVRFCIAKQYKATATIVPSAESTSLSGLSSIIKDFSVALPAGLSGMSSGSDMDLYNTLIYSRSFIELINKNFDLQKLYKIKSRETAIKAIRKTIKTNITMENAFVISVSSLSPRLACDITNYIVKHLNYKIVELHIAKSKDNRIFLEQRYSEIKENVKSAEDSLQAYQEMTGVFEANEQTKATLEGFAKLESDLAVKQVEYSILNKIYGENSPTTANAKISVKEYQNTLDRLKTGQEKSNIIIGMNSLPKKAKDYYRHFRDVKIYNEMLEFIIPLYEQSKFDEQRTVPILQVIDPAVPPEKKSYPPRTLMALFISCVMLFLTTTFLIVKEILSRADNPKIAFIKKELFNFKET
jgi:capsule polysaccharide export protein KpsE/RkpR